MSEISPLTNNDIDAMLQRNCKQFKGVFSCDNIPEYVQESKTFSIICNLSREGEQGSHFITILKT